MRIRTRNFAVSIGALGLAVALSMAGTELLSPAKTLGAVDAQASLVFKAVKYVGGVASLPALVGIAAVGALLTEIADSGESKYSIKIEFQKPPGRLELGMSMAVDVAVTFSVVDGWLVRDDYWVELFTLADGQIIKRMIYPKTGIKTDTRVLDDSEAMTFKDTVWVGTKEYKCVDGTTTYEFKAVVWNGKFGGRENAEQMTDAGDLSAFARGTLFGNPWEKKTWDEYLAWMGSALVITKDEASFDVFLESPYFIEVQRTDNGAVAEHGTPGVFQHTYTVNMNYVRTYPTGGGIDVRDPQPQDVTVSVDRLGPAPDWAPWSADAQLTWVGGQRQKVSEPFTDQGAHVPDPRPHMATYSDLLSATVKGKNIVEVQSTEDPSTRRKESYDWSGPFWLEGATPTVCEIPYTVSDFRPPLEGGDGSGGGGDDGGGGSDGPPPTATPTPAVEILISA